MNSPTITDITNVPFSNVLSARFSPDGTFLATSCDNSNLYLIDVKKGRCVCGLRFQRPLSVTCLLWPTETLLIVALSSGVIDFIAFDRDSLQMTLADRIDDRPKVPATSMDFDIRSHRLVIGSGPTIQVYRKRALKLMDLRWVVVDSFTPQMTSGGTVVSVAFIDHPSCKVIVAHQTSGFTLWSRPGYYERVIWDPIASCIFSPDRKDAIIYSPQNGIHALRISSKRPFIFKRHIPTVNDPDDIAVNPNPWTTFPLAFLPDGKGYIRAKTDGSGVACVDWKGGLKSVYLQYNERGKSHLFLLKEVSC
ncbi:hypothetical protein FRC02_005064 [Tulasnella sp. 418]|nr:hypothetical protein FRC02_005064 [Tulasnella sp. 418]